MITMPEKSQDRKSVTILNPATGETHKTYYLQTQKEAEDIIRKANTAFLSWKETPLKQRCEIIQKIGDGIEDQREELAEMMTRQMGKPIAQAHSEIDLCIQICRFTAEQAESVLSDEERPLADGGKGIITHQPLGVILGIQPWNFPMYQCVRYSLAVIAGGNTTVFRHASCCFETAQKIEEIYLKAGLPEYVFAPVYVDGSTSDELVGNSYIRGVTFTGSAEIGRKVAQKAGAALKKTVMELGGSDGYLVLDDADIDNAVAECVKGRTGNGGQVCIAAKRFIVHEAVYDEFRDKFVQAMKAVKAGDPLQQDTAMGPMVNVSSRDKLHEQVKETLAKGATLLCGGEVPEGPGAYYPATVLENVPEGTPAYDDELFGPVATLFRVSSIDEAVALSNSHRYGLGGGIFSGDKEKAIRIAREKLDTGMVNVNQYHMSQANMPFGGVKESGYGREHGGFGLREFVNTKSLLIAE